MKDFRDKVVVVTGAASGMGKAIALAFAREGSRLALADVNEEGLRSTADEIRSLNGEVYTQVVDVSQVNQVRDFSNRVFEIMGGVDILCNIAGVGSGGRFEDIPLEDWEWIMGANLWGVIYNCHFFYKRMVEQGTGGYIVNISSLTGLVPGVFATPYVTTKQAVQGFTETLRPEASLRGIGVSVLCPGYVRTNLNLNTSVRWGSRAMDFKTYIQRVSGHRVADERIGSRMIAPEKVAQELLKGIRKNKGIIIIGLDAYLPDIVYRISKNAFHYILRKMAALMSRRMERSTR